MYSGLNPERPIMSQNHSRGSAFTTIAVVSALFPSVAHASDPGYQPTYARGFEARTGYELTEASVRAALRDFNTLHLVEAISVVGEMHYESLVPFLKAILAIDPIPITEQAEAKVEYWRDPLFLYNYQTHAVRALIRCEDPDAPRYAIELASRVYDMKVVAGLYTVRNLKYLVDYPDVDIVAALKSIVESAPAKDHRFARDAGTELAELEHYFRLTLDPRKQACTVTIEDLLEGPRSLFHVEVESVRTHQPRWTKSYHLYNSVRVYPTEHSLLDEIVDFLLGR
jgi:hypothetical protein